MQFIICKKNRTTIEQNETNLRNESIIFNKIELSFLLEKNNVKFQKYEEAHFCSNTSTFDQWFNLFYWTTREKWWNVLFSKQQKLIWNWRWLFSKHVCRTETRTCLQTAVCKKKINRISREPLISSYVFVVHRSLLNVYCFYFMSLLYYKYVFLVDVMQSLYKVCVQKWRYLQ